MLRLGCRQGAATHRPRDTFHDQTGRLGLAAGQPCRAQRRGRDGGRRRHQARQPRGVCLGQRDALRLAHLPPQPRPGHQVRHLQFQAHRHAPQHGRAEHIDVVRGPDHGHRHALQQAMNEDAGVRYGLVE